MTGLTRTTVFALTLSMLLAAAASAQTAPYRGPVYVKPRGPSEVFQVKLHEEQADSVYDIHREVRFLSQSLQLKTEPFDKWTRRSDNTASARFSIRALPSINFTLSIYGKDAFMPDLEARSLKGFVEGLKVQFEKTPIEILNEGTSYGPSVPGDRRVLMNSTPASDFTQSHKKVDYVVTTKIDEQTEIRTRYSDYLVEVGDVIFVGTVWAPEEHFATADREFRAIFLRLMPLDA